MSTHAKPGGLCWTLSSSLGPAGPLCVQVTRPTPRQEESRNCTKCLQSGQRQERDAQLSSCGLGAWLQSTLPV